MLLAAALTLLMLISLQPVALELAQARARVIATNALNDAIAAP